MGKVLTIILLIIVILGISVWLFNNSSTPLTTNPSTPQTEAPVREDVLKLASEIAKKGWIVYCAQSDNGTWDLFASRPDGTHKRNITNTPDYEEAGPLFSRDNQRLLFRRLKKGTTIDHDLWGLQGQLMIANADGTHAKPQGNDKDYAWASWSPDGKSILCLTRKEIQVVDLVTKEIKRALPRNGIYQQLFWSSDGKWFTGTGNISGMQWCVVRMDAESGQVNPVIKFQSCTPDWGPDPNQVIFSSRPANQSDSNIYGWTQLYLADGEGKQVDLIYGEDGFHIYGGTLSPDSAYALFTKCPEDGGGPEQSGAPMCIVRMSDSPIIAGESLYLQKLYPDATDIKDAPTLTLNNGWEPIWTFAEVFSEK